MEVGHWRRQNAPAVIGYLGMVEWKKACWNFSLHECRSRWVGVNYAIRIEGGYWRRQNTPAVIGGRNVYCCLDQLAECDDRLGPFLETGIGRLNVTAPGMGLGYLGVN